MRRLIFFLVIIFNLNVNCFAQCPYDNSQYLTWVAPAVVGDSVSSVCTYAGEYNTVTGMVAGNTYQISTCSSNSFDQQISIYPSGGGQPNAYNDDFCGVGSAIYFTPINSGSYDILIDEYSCIHNSICTDLIVKLVFTPLPVITIPVVVHIVYSDSVENISDAQVQSQIDVLNEDFRRLNTDINNAPAVFRGVSYDPRIEFCLAQRDSAGFSTNGITRTYSDTTNYIPPYGLNMLFNSYGGKDPWDRTQYLNIWVGNMTGTDSLVGGEALGLGLPDHPYFPSIGRIGVILDYRVFGTIGTALPPYDKGRFGTHEVGHFLGLWHTWGIDPIISCSSDSVFDTPPQASPSFGCSTFPKTDNCSFVLSHGGVMFNNYMDYSDDSCRNMFTLGQVQRMDAMLNNQYLSFQTSTGCLPACIFGCIDSLALNYNALATCDDGSCNYSQNCPSIPPTGLFAFDVIDIRSKIGWDNMNDSSCMVWKYFVRYREVGTLSWNTKSAGVGNGLCNFGLNTVTKQLLNLTPSTTYEFKMKAFYCGGTSSNYSAPIQFTTADVCPDMTNLSVQTFNNNTSKAKFTWDTTGAYIFARITLRVDTAGANWQTAGGFGVYYPTLFVNKFGLQSGESYRAQGRTFCHPSITAYRSPIWTAPVFWTQPGTIRLEGGTSINNLDIYPNPSRDLFNISFNSETLQDLSIRILNVVGAQVYKETKDQFIGEYTKQISLENYGKGIYFLEIETSTGVVNKKLIMQ
jgi:hypothetical protein